ncbi:MAG: glycosyl transferase family 1, partial [Spirochaetales bacterium]|nr:glycosyl transferase family 1 [Spirochaetales bacterium]
GMCMGHAGSANYQLLAAELFESALPCVIDFSSPRAWAFALIGIDEYLGRLSGDRRAGQIREILAGKLVQRYRDASQEKWQWFEDVVSYSNARLSHALIISGQGMEDPAMLDIGLDTLRWLLEIQTSDTGAFQPVGSNGFYKKGKEKALFDQQPIEAQSTISACIEAYNATAEMSWVNEARRVFEWFLGRNDLGLALYDPVSGGCRDGLHADRLSQNQGAESTLSFLLSLEEMHMLQSRLTSFKASGNGKSV